MDLTPYTQNLRDDMLAAASVGDENTRRAAALLSTALEPAARLAIMNALSDLAAEITGSLDGTTVDLRLDGRELRVSVTHHEAPAGSDAGWERDAGGSASDESLSQAMRDAGGELSRTTLRLVNDLKAQAEQAATAQGVSLNTYIQRAVSDAVRTSVDRSRKRHGGPHTVTGYVRG